MNRISSRFSVCCRSTLLLRINPVTRSSKPISSSSSSSKLITVFISKPHHHPINYPSPIPQNPGYQFRKFSAQASQICRDDDHLKKEISEVEDEQWNAVAKVERGKIPPLDAVKDLADKFDALMEKLGLHYNEKEAGEDDEEDDYHFLISHYGEFPDHLKGFKKDIRYLQKYADMTVAYGEFVAAGGEDLWYPFMSHYRRMLRGEINEEYGIFKEGKDERADEKYRKILASLRKLKIRSRLMKRLLKAKSDSQSTIA